MFTLNQIADAHKKVTSGAAFPVYIQDLKSLGVTSYETFVMDGHTSYTGNNHYEITSEGKYHPLAVSQISNAGQFLTDLKAHQEGKTDYMAFCSKAAKSGIDKWAVNMKEMTCTYYDLSGISILVEDIPQNKPA